MSDLIRIKIEDRVYTIQPFNPLDGMEYGAKLLGLLAPALGGVIELTKEGGDPLKVGGELATVLKNPEVTPLLKQALGQCFTPENQSLADEAVFNAWFRKFPGDMFVLGGKAVWELVKDFLPKPLGITASGLQTSLSQALPSIK